MTCNFACFVFLK